MGDDGDLRRHTRALMSTSMFAPTERAITELALILLLCTDGGPSDGRG